MSEDQQTDAPGKGRDHCTAGGGEGEEVGAQGDDRALSVLGGCPALGPGSAVDFAHMQVMGARAQFPRYNLTSWLSDPTSHFSFHSLLFPTEFPHLAMGPGTIKTSVSPFIPRGMIQTIFQVQ